MQTSIVKFWKREWKSFEKLDIEKERGIFSRTMTQNTPPGWPQLGSQIMISL